MRVEQDVFEPMPELWEAEQLLEHKDNCTKCDKKYVLEAELKHHMALCHMKDKSSKLFTKAVPEQTLREKRERRAGAGLDQAAHIRQLQRDSKHTGTHHTHTDSWPSARRTSATSA